MLKWEKLLKMGKVKAGRCSEMHLLLTLNWLANIGDQRLDQHPIFQSLVQEGDGVEEGVGRDL